MATIRPDGRCSHPLSTSAFPLLQLPWKRRICWTSFEHSGVSCLRLQIPEGKDLQRAAIRMKEVCSFCQVCPPSDKLGQSVVSLPSRTGVFKDIGSCLFLTPVTCGVSIQNLQIRQSPKEVRKYGANMWRRASDRLRRRSRHSNQDLKAIFEWIDTSCTRTIRVFMHDPKGGRKTSQSTDLPTLDCTTNKQTQHNRKKTLLNERLWLLWTRQIF